jgi:hypothetical protein
MLPCLRGATKKFNDPIHKLAPDSSDSRDVDMICRLIHDDSTKTREDSPGEGTGRTKKKHKGGNLLVELAVTTTINSWISNFFKLFYPQIMQKPKYSKTSGESINPSLKGYNKA